MTQEGPQHTEDGGPGMPVPTDRSRVISENFKVEMNKGESGMKPMDVKIPGSVDLMTGQMSPTADKSRLLNASYAMICLIVALSAPGKSLRATASTS